MLETAALPATEEFPRLPLSEIAIRVPGSTAILHRYRLDFCCGGQKTLLEAAAEKQLDAAAISRELAALPGNAKDEQAAPTRPAELVAHIIARYHAVHREQFPELIRMAQRVETVHKERPDVPHGLATLLQAMQTELEQHMREEEEELFPLMQKGDAGKAGSSIASMRHDHDQQGVNLEKMAELTTQETPPNGACNTWRALYSGLAQLRRDLMQHIHLENNVLFPQFEGKTQAASASA